MMRATKPRKWRDPTIAMINVVFLMLIFFLLAGTIAAPLPAKLELVDTSGLEGSEPPDALVLDASGVVTFRGEAVELESFMSNHESGAVRIVPDRNSEATQLIEIAGSLRRLGASSVFLVTEQARE